MIRVIIEQGLLQLFDQVLKPLDRERIRELVQESVEKDDPAILRELLREISFVGPLQRSVESWAEGFSNPEHTGRAGDEGAGSDPAPEQSARANAPPGDGAPGDPAPKREVDG